jgi:hypothetical protein
LVPIKASTRKKKCGCRSINQKRQAYFGEEAHGELHYTASRIAVKSQKKTYKKKQWRPPSKKKKRGKNGRKAVKKLQ